MGTADIKPKDGTRHDIEITMRGGEPTPDISRRYVDMAIHSMICDAFDPKGGEPEPIWLINKRLFRPDESIPLTDEVVADRTTVIRLLADRE